MFLLLCLACTDRSDPDQLDLPDRNAFDQFVVEGGYTAEIADFEHFLEQEHVDGIVPAWHLWRQGTDWRSVQAPPFAIPPRDQWAGIVPTLKTLRDEVLPLTGPVIVVSGFRTESYNALAGGAKGSRHKWFEAVDVVPTGCWARSSLQQTLLAFWERRGPELRLGLGLYAGTRFHIDTWKYRRW